MSDVEKKENTRQPWAGALHESGPAFPSEEWLPTLDPYTINPIRHPGMSLRDYFAATALQGVLMYSADISKVVAEDCCRGGTSTFIEIATKAAYAYADAMLEARVGKQGGES